MKARAGAPLLTLAIRDLESLGYRVTYPPYEGRFGKNVRLLSKDGVTEPVLIQTRSHDRTSWRYTVGIMLADLPRVSRVILWCELETHVLVIPGPWLHRVYVRTAQLGVARYSNGEAQWRIDVTFDPLVLRPQGTQDRYDMSPYAQKITSTPFQNEQEAALEAETARLEQERRADIERRADELRTTVDADCLALYGAPDSIQDAATGERPSTYYERDPKLRALAVAIHGTRCMICEFDFGEYYGEWGKDYIEVHHVVPIAEVPESHTTNPETDMVVLCSNCHRMIHRRRGIVLTVPELKEKIGPNNRFQRISDPRHVSREAGDAPESEIR